MNSRRVVAVVSAVLAAVVVWFVVEELGGTDLMTPTMSGRPQMDISAIAVAITALVGTLIGWGLLALVERRARNPRRTFVIVAIIGTILSLGAPFSGGGLETNQRLLLALLHLTVAAVFIPLAARTIRTQSP